MSQKSASGSTGVFFAPFQAADALRIRLQPSQMVELGFEGSVATIEEARELELRGPAWTAIAGGEVLAIAGFAEIYPRARATAWALLAERIGPAHVAITRYARRQIAEAPYRRLEMFTEPREKCVQWARLLGFEYDPYPLRAFGPGGEHAFMFERIR